MHFLKVLKQKLVNQLLAITFVKSNLSEINFCSTDDSQLVCVDQVKLGLVHRPAEFNKLLALSEEGLVVLKVKLVQLLY